LAGGRSYLFQPPRRAVGPSGINPGFPGLSQCQGWVTHVLLTRSPLSPGPKARFSLDLHVLSAPPAFVLSQDQTLREESRTGTGCRNDTVAGNPHLELVLKGRPFRGKRRDDEVLMFSPQAEARGEFSTLEERSLLSFQRPVPRLDGVKKPPTRARGLQGNESYRIRVGAGRLLGSSCRDFSTPSFRTADEV
jgi:hypothetical protein